jgi:hypothetical protein
VAAAGDAYRLAVALNAELLQEDVAAAVRTAGAEARPQFSAGEPAAANL